MPAISVSFEERLLSGPPVLLDAALGSELERRGLAARPPLWSARALLEAPETVAEIHRENAEAGAEILTAGTFRTNRRALLEAGLGDRAAELTALAVRLAREAAEETPGVFVAGSIAPVSDCYRPDLVPGESELEEEHRRHVEHLRAAGVDLLLVETMNTLRELRAASAAAAASELPFIASVVTDGAGRLLSGEPLEAAVRTVQPLRPAAVGVNCVSPARLGEEIARLRSAAAGTPVAVYANILSVGDTPLVYAERAATWVQDGARIVGGCCGTTAAHIEAVRRRLGRVL